MKCIRNKETKKVMRVENDFAKYAVEQNAAEYVSKAVWKKETRDQGKKKAESAMVVKS